MCVWGINFEDVFCLAAVSNYNRDKKTYTYESH
jgi:hypothetical protein